MWSSHSLRMRERKYPWLRRAGAPDSARAGCWSLSGEATTTGVTPATSSTAIVSAAERSNLATTAPPNPDGSDQPAARARDAARATEPTWIALLDRPLEFVDELQR